MKRKELYEYIREEIINTLSTNENVTITKNSTIQAINTALKSQGETDPKVGADALQQAKNTGKTVTIATKMAEHELEEMANIASKIKIQDPAKFAIAKEIYTSGRTGAFLAALEAAGEDGMTQKELGTAVGVKNDSELNQIISNLRAAGVLSPKREKAVKPEKTSPEAEPELPTLSPEEEPEEETPDAWEKPEEEETPEEEPTAVSDKEIEKTVGKAYAELSPEEEKLFNTYKAAIVNKVKVINDKKASAADKSKAKAALDNYKTKEDVRKVFTKRGLKLIDFINSELKK